MIKSNSLLNLTFVERITIELVCSAATKSVHKLLTVEKAKTFYEAVKVVLED